MDVYKNFMVNSTTIICVPNFPSILILMRKKFEVQIMANLDICYHFSNLVTSMKE